jgi:hypothetical protein
MLRVMSGYRRLANNHDFTVLWIGQTVSELGSRVSMFVFPLLAYHLTGSALVAAAVEAVRSSPASAPAASPPLRSPRSAPWWTGRTCPRP